MDKKPKKKTEVKPSQLKKKEVLEFVRTSKSRPKENNEPQDSGVQQEIARSSVSRPKFGVDLSELKYRNFK